MIALLAWPLGACDGVRRVENRGYIATTPIEEEIRIGRTSQAEIRRKFGSPSTVSTYPPETWYYISRDHETVAFFSPELKGQQVARIEFDDDGRVAAYEGFDASATQDVEYVRRKTPTDGRSLGFVEQLLGNVGRFNTPRDATQARQ